MNRLTQLRATRWERTGDKRAELAGSGAMQVIPVQLHTPTR